jgi:hypothetical protein
MADTATAFTACDVVVELDDAGGTLRDISGSSAKVEANFDNNIGEFRTLGGSQWKNRIQCGKEASFKVTGIASTGTNEIRDIILAWFFSGSGLRTFRFAEPAGTAGSKRFAAECVLKSFKFSDDASDANPVAYEVELLPSGAVTMTAL